MSDAAIVDPHNDEDVGQTLILDGVRCSVSAEPCERLSATLRERLGARDVKIGCNAGDCGACTVIANGEVICACLMATEQADGMMLDTLGGLTRRGDPTTLALAQAFLNHGAAQCGICTPGMMMAAVALLRQTPTPTRSEVETALAGVLCRCTGYRAIIEAVLDVGSSPAAEGQGAIGESVVRIDGLPKVSGTERFGDDAAPADALSVRVIRSPYPHADFTIDHAAFAQHYRGLTLLTAADIPGQNLFGVIPPFVDQPVFAERTCRFEGEAVAAVVGDADAVNTVDPARFVRFTPHPAASNPDEALADSAAQLHAGRSGNILCRGRVACGDAHAALEEAHVTATGTFSSPFVEHAYIEPEAGWAQPVAGRVEIYASTQAPVMDQESVALILGVPNSDVRIVPLACGGGFGAKLDLSVQPYLAIAARVTGRPVRLTYSRRESMASSTKRHPSAITATAGATRDGLVKGFVFDGTFDTGAYASWGPTVANRVPVHASGPYAMPDYEARSVAVHTHNPPAGAFRGFGVPQSAIAQEVLFEDLALALEIDPLEFRRRNALTNGVPTVCGQVFEQGVGIGACLDALEAPFRSARQAAEAFNARARAEGSPLRRGVGIACGWYGCGNTSIPNPSTIKAGVTRAGGIVLHQGAVDIGQGANTVIAQIFATALGVPLSAITIVGPDTDVTPDAGKTSASRQTFVSGNAARLTGTELRATLLRQANAGDDAVIVPTADGLVVEDRGRRVVLDLSDLSDTSGEYAVSAEETYDPPTAPLDENGQGIPYALFGYAAHVAEVEVDEGLGTVKPLRFTAAHDVGKAINPVLIKGQIAGGIAQGLGMALMEEYIPGRTENLHDYLIPTVGDMPPVDAIIIEEADAHGPYGAKGLGEHCLIPTAPALLNAIRHATGVRLTAVPATPARLHAALCERNKTT